MRAEGAAVRKSPMPKALVIVESPAKAKTINKYLGKQYVVKASLGHIKDLPKTRSRGGCRSRFRTALRSHRGQEEAHRGAESKPPRRWKRSTSRPTRTAKAKRSATTCRKNCRTARTAPEDLPRDVQRDHQEGHRKGLRKARAGECATWWTRSRRAACSTGWWATRSRRCCGTRCAAGFPPAACRRWPCALIVEREREIRAFVPSRNTGRVDADLHAAEAAAARRPPDPGQTTRRAEVGTQEASDAVLAQLDGADYIVKSRRHAREEAQSGRARSSPRPCSRNRRASCASA